MPAVPPFWRPKIATLCSSANVYHPAIASLPELHLPSRQQDHAEAEDTEEPKIASQLLGLAHALHITTVCDRAILLARLFSVSCHTVDLIMAVCLARLHDRSGL